MSMSIPGCAGSAGIVKSSVAVGSTTWRSTSTAPRDRIRTLAGPATGGRQLMTSARHAHGARRSTWSNSRRALPRLHAKLVCPWRSRGWKPVTPGGKAPVHAQPQFRSSLVHRHRAGSRCQGCDAGCQACGREAGSPGRGRRVSSACGRSCARAVRLYTESGRPAICSGDWRGCATLGMSVPKRKRRHVHPCRCQRENHPGHEGPRRADALRPADAQVGAHEQGSGEGPGAGDGRGAAGGGHPRSSSGATRSSSFRRAGGRTWWTRSSST